MYRIVPSPLGGMWLVNENGVVLASGNNVHDLRLNMSMSMERRELNPFQRIADEFGSSVLLKDYIRRVL